MLARHGLDHEADPQVHHPFTQTSKLANSRLPPRPGLPIIGGPMWQGSKVGAQAAADQAALAAGLAITKASNPITEARAVTATFGYVHGIGGVTVVVNQPPTTGSFSTNTNAVEVMISRP